MSSQTRIKVHSNSEADELYLTPSLGISEPLSGRDGWSLGFLSISN